MAKFLKFIVNTIMIVAIVVAASLLIPPFAGVTTVIVDDIEMETNLEIGSVTYAWGVDAGELSVGDKVLLQEDGDMLYSVSAVEGSEFVLEDTLSADGEMVTKELQGIVEKVVLTVPVLGYVSMALRTVEGLIIVGLSVVFVIILFILAEIWRKEEEDDWEDEEESEESEQEDPDREETSTEETSTEETGTEEASTEETDKKDANESGDALNVSESSSPVTETVEELEVDSNVCEGQEEVETQVTTSDELVQTEKALCKAPEKETSKESKEKVLAMPSYTKEELLERAKALGDEPELVMDELSGVTFLDYSDVL